MITIIVVVMTMIMTLLLTTKRMTSSLSRVKTQPTVVNNGDDNNDNNVNVVAVVARHHTRHDTHPECKLITLLLPRDLGVEVVQERRWVDVMTQARLVGCSPHGYVYVTPVAAAGSQGHS